MNRIRFSTLLAVGVMLTIAACQSPAASLPTVTSLPPTAIQQTPAPSTAADSAQPNDSRRTIFSSKVYKLPLTLRFGPDWRVTDNYSDLVTVKNNQQGCELAFNIVTQAQLADPKDMQLIPFPDDFAAWITSNPDFKVSDPQPVMVAGIKGLQIDATPVWTSENTHKKPFLALRNTRWNIVTTPERWRFIVLDSVNGERLLILLISTPDRFNTSAQQAQAILDTVVFTK